MKKTVLDVYLAAEAAALASLDITSTAAIDRFVLDSFSGQPENQYEFFKNTFQAQRGLFKSLRAQVIEPAKVDAVVADVKA